MPALALTLVPGAPASCTAEVRALQPGSFADGADWAPAGAPQLPTLLNGYAVRPPWKVAGVDYAVGVPIGTALKDPTIAANLPTGVSVDTINHMIRVAASNVTLNGYDFGLAGGWGIYIEPGVNNTVIQNCNFLVGSNNQVPINAVRGAGSLTVQYNTINGGGGQRDAVWALVNDNGSGTFIAQYNNFLNAPCDAIDFSEAAIAPTIE